MAAVYCQTKTLKDVSSTLFVYLNFYDWEPLRYLKRSETDWKSPYNKLFYRRRNGYYQILYFKNNDDEEIKTKLMSLDPIENFGDEGPKFLTVYRDRIEATLGKVGSIESNLSDDFEDCLKLMDLSVKEENIGNLAESLEVYKVSTRIKGFGRKDLQIAVTKLKTAEDFYNDVRNRRNDKNSNRRKNPARFMLEDLFEIYRQNMESIQDYINEDVSSRV